MPAKTFHTVENLMRFVSPEPNSGCWLFDGSWNVDGYGRIRIEGKLVGAHRASYELHKGQIPPGMLVRHTCDNPPCCNPDHLLLGTKKDNAADMMKRGRRVGPIGADCHSAKLTHDDVREIRRRRASGEMYTEIAKDYPVAVPNVRKAALRGWKSVPRDEALK